MKQKQSGSFLISSIRFEAKSFPVELPIWFATTSTITLIPYSSAFSQAVSPGNPANADQTLCVYPPGSVSIPVPPGKIDPCSCGRTIRQDFSPGISINGRVAYQLCSTPVFLFNCKTGNTFLWLCSKPQSLRLNIMPFMHFIKNQ